MRYYPLVLGWLLALGLGSCHSAKKLSSPAPDVLPALPPSEIDLPIKIPGRALLAKADSVIPKEFLSEGWPAFLQPSCDFRYKYRFVRSGFTVHCTNNRIAVALQGSYQVAGGRCLCVAGKPVSPWVSGYCGFEKEPMRRVDLSFSTQLSFLPDYRLRTASGLDQLKALDRCTMSVFSVDMTQQIIDSIGASINGFCKMLDASIAKMNYSGNLHQTAIRAWQKTPIGPYGYLVINPMSTRVGTLTYAKDTFALSMGISCRPELVSDSTNPSKTPPLPPLSSGNNRSGVTLYLPASYDYAFINKVLNDSVRNRSFIYNGQTIIITGIKVSGMGQHQVKMEVDFGGSHQGQFFVWGTPTLDTAKQELRVPDIRYDLKSKEFLVKLAKVIFKNKIRENIQGNSFLDLAALLKTNLPAVNAQLNRTIAPGVATTGRVTELKLIGLLPGEKAIQAQLFVKADLAILTTGLLR